MFAAPTSPTQQPAVPMGMDPNVIPVGFIPPAVASQSPTASLYVGELDPSVTEAMLFELFNCIGPVASIRVCRDAVTRRSLGYSYVNYHNAMDGERALESLNYNPLKGRPMRIMWSQRDPALRKSGAGNIFIKSLDTTIDNKALHDTFSAFGNILSCKIAMDGEQSKGYGFVHFETGEAADAAIKNVNGMLLNDRKVFVGHHIPRKERMFEIEEQRAKFTNVYVKNLDEEVTDEEFTEMFSAFGPVTSAAVQREETGKSKGFGFVNYDNHEDASRAVEDMHEKEIKGKQLFVTRAQKKAEREDELRRRYEKEREEKLNKYQGVNLYVKNLDDSIDDESLRQEFAVYGVITSAKVMRDEKTNNSKGFGFVCFSSPDEATKSVTEMNGRMLGSKPIYVALAQRKELRRAQLSTQMQQRNQNRMMASGMPSGYPGAPMFYPNAPIPPQSRGFVFQNAGPRPRTWPQGMPQGVQPGYPTQGQIPQQFGAIPVTQGGAARPPRQARQPNQVGRGGSSMPQGQRPQGSAPLSQGVPPHAAGAGRGGRGGYKYATGPRGVPNPASSFKPVLNAATLAAAPADQQKRMLGESLFPLIQAQAGGEFAGKVTGMLLDMDNGELLHLLESPEALSGKVEEAKAVLEEHIRIQAENDGN